jgi:16S rRNA (guanine527-N7)-methyltransferase
VEAPGCPGIGWIVSGVAPDLNVALRSAGMEEVSPEAERQFAGYLALLLRWNAKLNLSAIREPQEIVRRHFVESIFAARQVPVGTETLLDYGSGGGFPGIPIAICRPEVRVTLAESQGKKAAFLREAVRTLGLTAMVFDRRVEEMPPDSGFDVVTLRAVDRMAEAWTGAVARVRGGGCLLAFATEATAEALRTSGAGLEWDKDRPVPGTTQGVLLCACVPRGTY